MLESLGIAYTESFLNELILIHPQYPSLLSIADALEEYGVGSLAVKLEPNQLNVITFPAVVHVRLTDDFFFYTVSSISDQTVNCFDEQGNVIVLSKYEFLKIWTGIALLVEKMDGAIEPGIKERIRDRWIIAGVSLLCASSLLTLLIFIYSGDKLTLGSIFYFVLKLLGLTTSIILLWYKHDKGNSILQKFCYSGKSVDCNTLLNSDTFQLLNGRINPSILAFSYFFAGTVVMVNHSLDPSPLLAWMSLVGIPVVILSLYYQAVVIKKWCRFCLTIGAIMAMEVISVLASGSYSGELRKTDIPLFIMLFTGVTLAWIYIVSLIGKHDEILKTKRNLAKLKGNKMLFEVALKQSRKITNNPEEIGIVFRGENPKYKVLKISSPYCEPCSKVHPILERLLEKGNIDLQILFTPGEGDEIKEKTIRHLVSIADNGNPEQIRQALDVWYSAKKKDYNAFADKFPINGEMDFQDKKIKAMEEWCTKEQISRTPTLFINGCELPEGYTVEDLKYLLN